MIGRGLTRRPWIRVSALALSTLGMPSRKRRNRAAETNATGQTDQPLLANAGRSHGHVRPASAASREPETRKQRNTWETE